MAAGDMRVGLDGKFLYGAAGSTASTEASNVDNVTLNLSAQVAEAIKRGKTWKTSKVTILEASIDFETWSVEGDAFISAVKAAFIGRSRIALYPKDADGGEGLNADYYISSFSRNESNPEFIKYSVTAVTTDEIRDPAWS